MDLLEEINLERIALKKKSGLAEKEQDENYEAILDEFKFKLNELYESIKEIHGKSFSFNNIKTVAIDVGGCELSRYVQKIKFKIRKYDDDCLEICLCRWFSEFGSITIKKAFDTDDFRLYTSGDIRVGFSGSFQEVADVRNQIIKIISSLDRW